MSQSVQFESNLVICREKLPAVESNKPFEYLGKQFNFEMKINEVQEELEKRVISYLTVTANFHYIRSPKFRSELDTYSAR